MTDYLWTTNVGSHMWGMNHAKSDTDYFSCYLASTHGILAGTEKCASKQTTEEGDIDRAVHELGKTIHYLSKGNVNFLWGVYSPIIVDGGGFLKDLREQAPFPGANAFHSIRGMAKHNYKHFILDERAESMDSAKFQKKLNTIARTVQFGITLLKDEEIRFEKVKDVTEAECVQMMRELEAAYDETKLPELPAWDDEILEWLVEVRQNYG